MTTMTEANLSALDAVIGQPEALVAIRRALRLRELAGSKPAQPTAFVFIGPDGCGKGFAADSLARLDHPGRPLYRVAMGTYQSDNEAAGLIGVRSFYKTARPGELTSFVRENPEALLIFEDFDRAHPNVQDVLAPMLAKGVLVDQCGFHDGDPRQGKQIAPPEVNFSRTLIVFTTSLGRKLYDDEAWVARMTEKPGMLDNILVQEVASATSDHYASRQPAVGRSLMAELGNLEWVLFRRLDLDALMKIAGRQFESLEGMVRNGGYGGVQLGDGGADDVRELLTTVVLANGPEPKPALLDAQNLARTYLGPVLEQAAPARGTLTVNLAETAKINLRRTLAELGENPLRNLFRKNWTLTCHPRAIVGEDGNSVITIEGCEPERVPNRRDFGGVGGLAVNLPEQRFADIAGHAEAKRRLKEIIGLLQAPGALARWDVEAPRGMLLWGPPGTGKTMLARAFACEADLPFVATTGSELLDPRNIDRVFDLAREYAPAAIFIDEIDALGRRDQGGAAHAINHLLSEIDGFAGAEGGIFVIAASNLPERIDPAILRSGRLDLQIHIPPLDAAARAYFVDRLRGMARLSRKDWRHVIELSAGMTGADLEKLRRELAYDLLRLGRARATRDDIVEHINVIKYGIRDTRERTREEFEHIAWHEAGHIVLSQLLNPDVAIRNASITGRGNAAGFVEFDGEAHRNRRMTRKEVKEDLIILMGGRAAQVIKFGEDGIDAGVADDLAKARELARRAIAEWGMEMVGAAETERHVGQWLASAEIEARRLLESHCEAVETTYCRLISKVE